MKHKNTQLCVDSLPVFNSSLIPLRSAHHTPDSAHPVVLLHLVEPNSAIILAYGHIRAGEPKRQTSWSPSLNPIFDPLCHMMKPRIKLTHRSKKAFS